MSESLFLFSDRVLIKPEILEAGARMRGGIIIPDNAKYEFQYGDVVAVGEGYFDRNGKEMGLLVNVGDTVLFSKYSGTEISFDGVDYLMVPEKDLLARVAS